MPHLAVVAAADDDGACHLRSARDDTADCRRRDVLFSHLSSKDHNYTVLYGTQTCAHRHLLSNFITSDKGGGKCFCPCSFVCLSVCLLARLLKNACMYLDEMLRVDRCRDAYELNNF